MRLALEVVGVPEVCAGIEQGVTRMQIAAARQMGGCMEDLRNYTLQEHMHGTGPTSVAQRSGNLARSGTVEVTQDSVSVTGSVGFGNAMTAPYARILHEGGTTRAHVIEASEGKTLAFMAGGQMIFRRKVNHPGSNFPPRPYLTAALEEQAAQIKANLTQAIVGANA